MANCSVDLYETDITGNHVLTPDGDWVDYYDYKELKEKYDELVTKIGDLWRGC